MNRIKNNQSSEKAIKSILFLCGAFSVFITLAIIIALSTESIIFFRNVPMKEFFLGLEWTPLFEPKKFGVLPLIAGTFLIVVISSVIALPVGLLSAIYLSEYCDKSVRKYIKPVLELLAGIPSIVYGFFALTAITPYLRTVTSSVEIYNALSASIAVGIMIIPLVLSMSEDAMQAVPSSLREGAYALGMTKLEVVTTVVLPAAVSGIMASFVLSISRAIGETMIVALAAGSTPNLTINPLESIQTMTGYIVQVATGDAPKGSIQEQTLTFVPKVLSIFIAIMLMGHWMLNNMVTYMTNLWQDFAVYVK